jgi:hypothetical protein
MREQDSVERSVLLLDGGVQRRHVTNRRLEGGGFLVLGRARRHA